jgi:Eco57I restriction-modification methylase
MNNTHIKSYAPRARVAFIAAMTKQAAKYGITADSIAPLEIKGDLALINERPFKASIAKPRASLVQKIEQQGFDQVMEQVAYSWFNRLCAIRFMELKDYLGHGRRVLSHPDQPTGFQLLEDCLEVELPGLDQTLVHELKLDGTKDEELYRELLLAQCHALHTAMPFLFEALDDETELLLPENLTKTDSLIRELVDAIPEDDWADVEIIGWLYQFYISEKKDQVIGKVVKSEDIPAATQLFTPNWIVKYMVQNSLGAQWLATYPDSPLKAQMDYYIEPAEQTDEVNAELAKITPESLNPEELTLIDPASGSGHILVEAYDLFKAIYLERGYRQRDIAQLILEKNLFGLDIDGRAAQLAGFALMMKGREDDRRLFDREVKLNVMALQDSRELDIESLNLVLPLASFGLAVSDLLELNELFEHATTFGSLIQVPHVLAEKLPAIKELAATEHDDWLVSDALQYLSLMVRQAEMLATQYDAVVANPPYMGMKAMNGELKVLAASHYPDFKLDTYSVFVGRALELVNQAGKAALVTMHSWMFLHRFEAMRQRLLENHTLLCLGHLGARAFPSISGEVVQTCCFVINRSRITEFHPIFSRCVSGAEADKQDSLKSVSSRYSRFTPDDFLSINGNILAYWISKEMMGHFHGQDKVSDYASPRHGMVTSDNERFLRFHWEVSKAKQGFGCLSREDALESSKKWFPYNKGGPARRWYGNAEYLLNWEHDGQEVIGFARELYGSPSRKIQSQEFYFRDGLTWSALGSGDISLRANGAGFLFDSKGSSMFFESDLSKYAMLGLFNSNVAASFISVMSPTLDFSAGSMANMPLAEQILSECNEELVSCATACVDLSKTDWDTNERSWDFQSLPILTAPPEPSLTLESSYNAWVIQNRDILADMKRLEEDNNRLFIDAYGLQDELIPDISVDQITLRVNPAHRYGIKGTEEERNTRFREDSMQELISYAIGCMMGRYSLDEPGLIYANTGNEDFDASKYTRFPADDDGIVPLSDTEWFGDDAANRVEEFIGEAWDKASLEDNLAFLAANLSPKKGEGSRDTIRRYLCDKFYKDHMQTYKKRPIYWLFSSGKQKAFQCLVYLHRYNEGTLARMRTEYVIPLSAKLATHVEKLEQDKDASGSAAEVKRLEKQITKLHKQQVELSSFDEKLRHYADQRISLELDDGVKVNYGKFGDLLAEVKAIHGKKVV